MFNLFVDTNIFLNLYSFSKDDLKKWDILIKNIKENKIKLMIPYQVVDEFYRNREKKLKETLKEIRSYNPSLAQPVLFQNMPLMNDIQHLISMIISKKIAMLSKIEEDIRNNSLDADKLIDEVFKHSTMLEIRDKIVKKAKRRILLGNPPGKVNSIGDSINWECLIENIPEGEDLYFISFDDDYTSPMDDKKLSQFLTEEWKNLKKSKIHFYKFITEFFKDKFPQLNITSKDIEKEADLSESYSNVSGWEKYSNKTLGFSVKYPPFYTANEPNVLGKNFQGILFPIPEYYTKGTNLNVDSYISIERSPINVIWQSKELIQTINFETFTEFVNDVIYDVSKGVEGACGSTYDEIVSVAQFGNYSFCFRLLMRSGHVGAYEPPVKRFDYKALINDYNNIRRSFKPIQIDS